ncbi:SRPBCC family protein [Amycolatopsis panacis]|uniref:Carbon monoxide dehydrogenase n=1 Tax=Amycolatopsis panacis TaxID=2340917 RepID=A0A419IBH2_9PSEU|nr:SRPBCC family protein [Amycolatopsis panacis]RJQ92347.1 carbon monoxide dehydrogenase [Amycolatopsis panacis]
MILENTLDLPGDPDTVFALLNDVERMAGCLPGATLEGQDGDAYLGKVKVKVGPVSAAYSGKVRFTEVARDERRLRLSARGADSHGSGDAEADVTVVIEAAPGGSVLKLHTDLVIRGKIAQFGKGAISAVSNRILDQFARNLAGLLQPGGSPAPAATAPAPAPEALDGLAMFLSPQAKRYLAIAAAGALGLFQGWLLGRIRTQDKLIEELRRDR